MSDLCTEAWKDVDNKIVEFQSKSGEKLKVQLSLLEDLTPVSKYKCFSDTLFFLKLGRKMTRKSWIDKGLNQYLLQVCQTIKLYKDGDESNWEMYDPTQEDILAEDWMKFDRLEIVINKQKGEIVKQFGIPKEFVFPTHKQGE